MTADKKFTNELSAEKELVHRYFHEVLDQGKVELKTVTWNAIAIFRFENHKIIEEWVTRGELGMILQFGLFEPPGDIR